MEMRFYKYAISGILATMMLASSVGAQNTKTEQFYERLEESLRIAGYAGKIEACVADPGGTGILLCWFSDSPSAITVKGHPLRICVWKDADADLDGDNFAGGFLAGPRDLREGQEVAEIHFSRCWI